jgi:hypothetical protein
MATHRRAIWSDWHCDRRLRGQLTHDAGASVWTGPDLDTAGIRVLNPEEVGFVSANQIEEMTRRVRREVERKEALYRKGRPARGRHPDSSSRDVRLSDLAV